MYSGLQHYRSSGLAQAGAQTAPEMGPVIRPETDPLWARLVAGFATPFTQALATRVAYGGGGRFPAAGIPYMAPGGMAFGGISTGTLVLIGLGLAAAMMLGRR